jgi:hypothetical protein
MKAVFTGAGSASNWPQYPSLMKKKIGRQNLPQRTDSRVTLQGSVAVCELIQDLQTELKGKLYI